MERLFLTERLINADELINHLDYVCTGAGLWSNILNDVIEDCKEFVNHEPTVDAVQVVRCKDCKNRKTCEIQWNIDDDFYCADGERKDDDNK